MKERYCGNCGHERAPEDRFCPGCGVPLGNPEAVENAPVENAPVENVLPESVTESVAPEQPRRHLGYMILGSALLLCGIICTLILALVLAIDEFDPSVDMPNPLFAIGIFGGLAAVTFYGAWRNLHKS